MRELGDKFQAPSFNLKVTAVLGMQTKSFWRQGEAKTQLSEQQQQQQTVSILQIETTTNGKRSGEHVG